jgi:hypothetical protein
MSIIIIGVGIADFYKMEDLDSDTNMLTDKHGKRALRDIVQFVEFNKFANDLTRLSEDVLREVPNQLVSYMTNNGITPAPNPHDDLDGVL